MNRHSHNRIILALGVLSLLSLEAAMALEDPTRPTDPALSTLTHAAGPENSSWVLNSTLVASNRRIAVINGTQVSEGESVGGARVVQIHKSYALLQTSGRSIKLHLLPDTVKK
jgi:hypothetical protein